MASVPPKPLAQATGALVPSLARLAGHNYIFVRVAAVSGAAAVALAAYGKHKMKGNEELRSIYESANNMHLVHSVVLLAVPLTRRPVVVSCFRWFFFFFYYFFKEMFFIFICLDLFAEWLAVYRGHGIIQRHLLLQGDQEVARRKCRWTGIAVGAVWRRLLDSRMAEFVAVNLSTKCHWGIAVWCVLLMV